MINNSDTSQEVHGRYEWRDPCNLHLEEGVGAQQTSAVCDPVRVKHAAPIAVRRETPNMSF